MVEHELLTFTAKIFDENKVHEKIKIKVQYIWQKNKNGQSTKLSESR